MNDFRAAVIGSGGFARDIAAHLPKSKELLLVGAYDADVEVAQGFVRDYGGRAYGSFEELLGDDSLDGVLIVTPNDTHFELIEMASRAGKHVFVEKPITNDIRQAKAAIKVAADAGVTLFVGHVARRSASARMAKGIVDAGALGTLVLIEGHIAHNGGLRLTADMWRWYRDRCPGGPMMQLAVHTVDTFNYLLGPVRSVTAMSGRRATPAEIDDVGVIALEYESGVLGYIGTAYTVPSSNFMNIYGTEALLQCDRTSADFIMRYKDDRVETRSAGSDVDPIAEELDDFARSARQHSRPETGGEEGLQALAVILAAIRSSEEGRKVTIEEMLADSP